MMASSCVCFYLTFKQSLGRVQQCHTENFTLSQKVATPFLNSGATVQILSGDWLSSASASAGKTNQIESRDQKPLGPSIAATTMMSSIALSNAKEGNIIVPPDGLVKLKDKTMPVVEQVKLRSTLTPR